MKDFFIFDDIDTRDYGIAVFNMQLEDSPVCEETTYSVPGRNGDLVGVQHRLKNCSHEYMAVIYDDFARTMAAFRDAVISKRGYKLLIDSFHPEEFYLARYVGPVELKTMKGSGMGKVLVEFNRKPQRYLISGAASVEVSTGGALVNPTNQDAQPLIRVTGYGTLNVGAYTLTIASGYTYIDIDCELMDCYYGAYNANELVTITGNDFPVLVPGSNGITFSGNITKVEVTPRWWRA